MWEYKVLHLTDEGLTPDTLTKMLCEHGSSGWELVSVFQRAMHGYTHGATFVLKRPLPESG